MLEKRGSIPEHVQILDLETGPIEEVRSRMHQEGIMETMDFDHRLQASHPEPVDKARSTVILLDGRMIGALVVAPFADGKGYLIPGRWVIPGMRYGWVNALLMITSMARGLDLDLDYIRFVANSSRHTETTHFAERMGGYPVLTRYRWSRSCLQER